MSLLFPRLAYPDDRLAVSVDGRTLDYRSLARRAAAHAAALTARGVIPGDVVAVAAHGHVDTVAMLVGNQLAGAVSLPLNPKLGTAERAHVLRDAAPACLYSAVPDDGLDALAPTLDGDAPAPRPRRVDGAPALLLYTSGTTGAPKGAMHSSASLAANLDGLATAWGLTDADTVVHALPLFHVHGLVLGVFGPLRFGGGVVHRSKFAPDDLARALTEGTVLYSVPTMMHRLARAAGSAADVRSALQHARLLVCGSAALPRPDHEQVEALTGRSVVERYGLTETLIVCAVTAASGGRPGYVGPPVPGVEVRLVDDARRPLDVHDDETFGEVAVRGPSVFLGYRNRPDATAEVLDSDGWFYTGDLATRTKDGALRIVGRRATDLIKTGGFKVGAGEIEACLLDHPEVAECAVVGRPDDDLGEAIVAYVVARGAVDAAALADHVARHLAPHKRPRRVEFVAELPRNPLGKVQKSRLP